MATHNTIPKFLGNEKNTIQELLRRIDKLECCLKELEATVAAGGGGGAGDAGDAGNAVTSVNELVFSPSRTTLKSEGLDFAQDATLEIDFSRLQSPETLRMVILYGFSYNRTILSIANAGLLTDLEDYGTAPAMYFYQFNMSDTVIDSLFTQLPPTVRTATIDLTGSTGAATCDPTIATSKGYTVIT